MSEQFNFGDWSVPLVEIDTSDSFDQDMDDNMQLDEELNRPISPVEENEEPERLPLPVPPQAPPQQPPQPAEVQQNGNAQDEVMILFNLCLNFI